MPTDEVKRAAVAALQAQAPALGAAIDAVIIGKSPDADVFRATLASDDELDPFAPPDYAALDLKVCTGCGATIVAGEDCPHYGYGETHA